MVQEFLRSRAVDVRKTGNDKLLLVFCRRWLWSCHDSNWTLFLDLFATRDSKHKLGGFRWFTRPDNGDPIVNQYTCVCAHHGFRSNAPRACESLTLNDDYGFRERVSQSACLLEQTPVNYRGSEVINVLPLHNHPIREDKIAYFQGFGLEVRPKFRELSGNKSSKFSGVDYHDDLFNHCLFLQFRRNEFLNLDLTCITSFLSLHELLNCSSHLTFPSL